MPEGGLPGGESAGNAEDGVVVYPPAASGVLANTDVGPPALS